MKCSIGEEVQILHCSTINALNVYTHPRFLCALYPFAAASYKNNISRTTTINQLHCAKCFCYICQIEASKCKKWKNHCNANEVTAKKPKQPTWTTQEVIDVDEEDESSDSEGEFENENPSESEEGTTKSSSSDSEGEYETTSESDDGSSVAPKTTSKKLHKTRVTNNCISNKRTNNSKSLKARRSNLPEVMGKTALSAKRNTSSKHETSLAKKKAKSSKKETSSRKTKKKSNKSPAKKDSIERISKPKRVPKPNTPSNASPAANVNSNKKGKPDNSSKNKKSSTTTKKQSNKQLAKKGNTAASKKRRKISSA
jgi:hypothetical protein